MKNIKKLIFLVTIALAIFSCNKEKTSSEVEHPIWIEMMEQPSVNMTELRESFDNYWKTHTHHKGDRSKQFEQWYAINSKRLDIYGNVISAEDVRNEFQRIRSNANLEQFGNWYNYGPLKVGPRKDGAVRDGGRVKNIAFHPTDENTFYVSTFKGGLFKTSDSGQNWLPLTDHLTQEVYISKVIASNPNSIVIGTNTGVLKTIDGGINWASTTLTSGKIKALAIKSDDDTVIIAGSQTGIYRSTDIGATFTQVLSTTDVEEIVQHPTNPLIFYAGTNGSSSQFFVSADGGITWTENKTDFSKGSFMKIAVTPAAPNNVYVINARDHLGQDSFDGVYVSTNSGTSFTKKSGTTPCITGYNLDGTISRGQPNYNLFIVVDPVNPNLMYAGGVKSWKSTDGGVNWSQSFDNVTPSGHGLHLDQLSWAYSPLNNKLYALNDGGIYYLNDTNKFVMITDGLPIAEVWECTQSQQNKSNVAGGTFHCGIKLNKNGKWYSPWGGDEATVLFDYSDDTYAYHFKYEKISRSIDGGMSFQRINPSTADRGLYTGTGVVDKSDVNTIFVGLLQVERINNARTANNSQVWDKISSFSGSSKIQKIEQSDANHNIMYVAREDSKFYRSDNVRDASPTFSEVALPFTGRVQDIATHPTNDNIVYILLGNKIFKSINKGNSWTDISSGLPGIALLEMVYDKSSNEGIYVGTDVGVYYKDATLNTWIDYSKGLPAIRVSGMDIFYGQTRKESILTISTDGRGFWRSALNDVQIIAPKTSFTSDKTSVFKGNAINYIDATTENPLTWEWTFEGGTPATSDLQNPVISYSEVGTFKTTLKTTNSAGSNIKEIESYITVTENNATGNLQFQYDFINSLNDDSPYARNLSAEGSFTPSYTTDKNGVSNAAYNAPESSTSYLFNSYKGVANNEERTVTAWIKTTTAGTRKTILSWGKNTSGAMFNVMVENGNIRVEGGASNVQNDDSSVTRLDNDVWRHITVTYNPNDGNKLSDIKIYIDGVYYANQSDSEDSYNSESTVINTDNTLENIRIGAASYSSNYYWRGQLDDVRLYSKELSASEITKIMAGGTLKVTGLVIEKNELKVYPNKVKNILNITSKTSFSKNLKLNIYNINGQDFLVKYSKVNDNDIKLDMSKLANGVYFVNVADQKKISTFKIIKAN